VFVDGPFQSREPFTKDRIGAVAIYCSDGRYNEQFDEFLHEKLGLPRYDRLVIPGGAACLAGHMVAHREEEVLAESLRFLIDHHGLERVVLIAHAGCGYYLRRLMISEPNIRRVQEEDLAKAADKIARLSGRVKVEGYVASVIDGTVVIEGVGR
jgi:hypothetical protein